MEFKEIESKIESFGKDHPTYWGCALAGEAGEVANILKKWERDGGDVKLAAALAKELADVFLYTVLTAREFQIDLENAILTKINIVRERRQRRKKNEL